MPKNIAKMPFSGIKSAFRPIETGGFSYLIYSKIESLNGYEAAAGITGTALSTGMDVSGRS